MEKDKLEKFVMENREDFDVYEPDDKFWDKIQKSTNSPVRIMNWKSIMMRAAAVVIIFIASYYFHDLTRQDISQEVTTVSDEQPDEQMQILMEAEVFYTSKINTAMSEFILLSGNDKNLIEDLKIDLGELDDIFAELKNDLKENGNNQDVIEAMIQNYRIKLQILEEMVEQMNKVSGSQKIEGHEI
jgi:hypothetical protein